MADSNDTIVMSLDEVSSLLGFPKADTFKRRYKSLVDKEGFPLRLPGGNFYRPAIETWMMSHSLPTAMSAPNPIEAQRQALMKRYQAGAA